VVISQGDWHGITLSLSFRIITAFLTITVSYYRSSNLFVQTDVNTAITTTVAFYVIYYNKLYTPQWRSESYIWTGHDDQHRVQRTASIFLTSFLNGAECPMSHNGQSHNFFTIFPNKTDSKNVTTCRELQWQTDDTFTWQVWKQCLLYFDIQKSANKSVQTQ